MTYIYSTMIQSVLSRAVTGMALLLCFSVAQSSILGDLLPEEAQADDDHAKEVLKLQAEKRDSMDRLEKNAAEIARKWRARQAQEQASKSGQSKKPSGQEKQGSGTKTQTEPNANQGMGKANSEPEGPNPLLDSGKAEANTAGADAIDNSTGSDDAAAKKVEMKAEMKPSVMSDPAVRVASGTGFVDGPIDRLALATSLYATNQFRECLKILEAVELRPLSTEDRQWHDYLMASCYRKLGNRDEAEDYYRSVLQRSSSTWVSAAARWWLGHMDEKSQLQTKLEKVQITMENWRKEIDVLKSAN
ncbi:MAG: CDC27 family protein [Fuerstiella sp.]